MGDPEAADTYQHDEVDADSPEPTSTGGGVGLPTGALSFGQLDALTPDERGRAARKRGLDWPTTEEARDRLKETIRRTPSAITATARAVRSVWGPG